MAAAPVLSLAVVGLVSLAFIAWLTVDGLRALLARRTAERRRRTLPMRITRRDEVAGELLCLSLASTAGRLPAFSAGQHVLLEAPAGKAGRLIRRAYSLAAWQARPGHYELGIKREGKGAMTQWLWNNALAGTILNLSRPQGEFVVEPATASLVLIGGGIGITPMRAMLHATLPGGRPVTLFHAARHPEQLLYRAEFEALATQHPQFRYIAVVSRPDANWTGRSGRLDGHAIVAAIPDAPAADYYLCAGNDMLAALRTDLQARGVAAERLHWEVFNPGTASNQASLEIVCRTPGGEKRCQSRGEPTLLATLEANAIELPSECRAGSCGLCQLGLVAGDVEWLLAPEFAVSPGNILPCVCAPRTKLELHCLDGQKMI